MPILRDSVPSTKVSRNFQSTSRLRVELLQNLAGCPERLTLHAANHINQDTTVSLFANDLAQGQCNIWGRTGLIRCTLTTVEEVLLPGWSLHILT